MPTKLKNSTIWEEWGDNSSQTQNPKLAQNSVLLKKTNTLQFQMYEGKLNIIFLSDLYETPSPHYHPFIWAPL